MTTTYLLDARALEDGSSVRGIGTYVRGLLAGMDAIGEAKHFSLLTSSQSNTRRDATFPHVGKARARLPVLKRSIQPLADPFLIARAIHNVRPSLYHGTEFGQPIVSKVPVVVTVHDLIPSIFPDQYRWTHRGQLLAIRLLRHADAVLADSQSTARDLERIAHVDPSRITVVPLAVAPHFAPVTPDVTERLLAPRGITRPYVLAVGTFDPRKRIQITCDVVRKIREHHDIDLVIAGDQGAFMPQVSAAIDAAGLRDHTHLLGFVSTDELTALYSATRCLIFTSAYEGFGLPPLEAMACGAPVAVFDNSSLPEVAGDVALMFADGDATAMASGISRLISDENERALRINEGQAWSATFTWERTASETLAIYHRCLNHA